MYQVSSPCCCCGRHDVAHVVSDMYIPTKFHEAFCCYSNKVVVMKIMLHACVPSFISMRGTVSEFEEWRSNHKENITEAFCCCGRHGNDVIPMRTKFHFHACYRHVLLWFWCWLLRIQTFVHIALTNCELHWGNFYSKQHCLQTKKYDVAHVVSDMYIPTKFHGFISFGFWVTLVEEEEDEQNSLS